MRCGGWALLVALGMTACGGKAQTPAPPPLDWTLHSVVWDENMLPVDGVQLCVDGHPEIPCATTGDAGVPGVVNLALPSGKDLLVSYEKPGFYPKLREVSTRGEPCRGLCEFQLQRRKWYYDVVGPVGGKGALDLDNRGGISIETHNAGNQVTFKLHRRPSDSVGPMYMTVVHYSPYVTLCSQGSTCGEPGLAVWENVLPGDYTVTIITSDSDKGSNIECTRTGFECSGDPANCVTMHVEAGKLTFAGGFLCK